jgi:hypothetical protein
MSSKRIRDASPSSAETTRGTKKSKVDTAADETPKSSSIRFLDLPREIRDMGYEYVVGKHRDGGPVCYAGQQYIKKQYDRACEGTEYQEEQYFFDKPSFTSILFSSKQFREEASKILLNRTRSW